jgi:hypothetical protein
MTILRPLPVLAVCLVSLTFACAGRAPLPGPDPVMVRSTIQAQIAQSVSAIRENDNAVTALPYRQTSRR